MNKTLLAACLMLMTFVVSAQTKQTEDNKKTESKPMRKIATGSGMEEIQTQIDEAMKEVRIELENLDVQINQEVMRELENLDEVINEEVRLELENLDETINAELENLQNLEIEIDEDIHHDLEHLKDLEIDLDLDLDINIGEIVRQAVNIDVKEITETVNTAVQETIKVTTKKKVQE